MKVAILGAGKVGTAIARVALETLHEVRIAGSGAAAEIQLLVEVVAPGATPSAATEAVGGADLVVLAIPAPKFRTLDASLLRQKVVVDATNYWPDTDGVVDDFTGGSTSSEVIAAHLSESVVVKTLNHIGYHELESDRRVPGDPERRALAVASTTEGPAATVAAFVTSIGYDLVIATPLARGRLLQPGTLIFSTAMNREELARALTAVPPGPAPHAAPLPDHLNETGTDAPVTSPEPLIAY